MDIGKKAIVAGLGIFLLGGLCVYLFMVAKTDTAPNKRTTRQHGAMREAIAQIEQKESVVEPTSAASSTSSDSDTNTITIDQPEMTHSAFLADAEARREQQLISDAETQRLNKLRRIKQNSVECKFWKQQQQTSSAAAKIAANIEEHCLLAVDRSTTTSRSPNEIIE